MAVDTVWCKPVCDFAAFQGKTREILTQTVEVSPAAITSVREYDVFQRIPYAVIREIFGDSREDGVRT